MYYIYKFIDGMDNTLYVGITGDIKVRIRSQHFGGNGHLTGECYDETSLVVYSKCESKDDALIKERYLINILSPKYNNKMSNGTTFNYVIDDFEWKYIGFNKERLCEKPQKKATKLIVRPPQKEALDVPNIELELSVKSNILPTLANDYQWIFQYPGETTVLHVDRHVNVRALRINGTLYLLTRSLLSPYSGVLPQQTAGLLKYLSRLSVPAEQILVIENKQAIKEMHACTVFVNTPWEDSKRYPQYDVLVGAKAVPEILQKQVEKETATQTMQLTRDGRFRISRYYQRKLPSEYKHQWFTSMDDYLAYLKKYMRWSVFHDLDALQEKIQRTEKRYQDLLK